VPGSDFFGPVPYSPVSLVLGIALVVAVAGWYAGLLLVGRGRRAPDSEIAAAGSEAPRAALPELRAHYLGLLDGARTEHLAGALDDRALALRVSQLVRAFATEAAPAGADDARTMALTDLRAAVRPGLAGPIADLVGAGYPSAFASAPSTSSVELLDAARELVATWM